MNKLPLGLRLPMRSGQIRLINAYMYIAIKENKDSRFLEMPGLA
jgi:hypothetical protein